METYDMWEDPIVNEVRKAGEDLAKQANYDLHTFFQNLRNNAKNENGKQFQDPKKNRK